jgi:predicted PurR-regulated permease PerM
MGMIDNILKPVLMGKGMDVPMLVIFLGALGGFIAFGFIGLFLGAIVLSLVHKMYITWVNSVKL